VTHPLNGTLTQEESIQEHETRSDPLVAENAELRHALEEAHTRLEFKTRALRILLIRDRHES